MDDDWHDDFEGHDNEIEPSSSDEEPSPAQPVAQQPPPQFGQPAP